MKTLFATILLALTNAPALASDTTQTACYVVEGMTCAACTVTLKAAIKRLDGISSVKALVEEKSAIVEFDPKRTNIDAIKKVINSIGYSAKSKQCGA